MPATTQCRGLVDVLLSLSLFLSMLTTHGIGVLTLLVFLSALRFAAMLESCYQVSHTHTHTFIITGSVSIQANLQSTEASTNNGVTNAIPIPSILLLSLSLFPFFGIELIVWFTFCFTE